MSPSLPPVLAPDELADVLQAHPQVRLIGVRTPGGYGIAHIRGAHTVPLDRLGEHDLVPGAAAGGTACC